MVTALSTPPIAPAPSPGTTEAAEAPLAPPAQPARSPSPAIHLAQSLETLLQSTSLSGPLLPATPQQAARLHTALGVFALSLPESPGGETDADSVLTAPLPPQLLTALRPASSVSGALDPLPLLTLALPPHAPSPSGAIATPFTALLTRIDDHPLPLPVPLLLHWIAPPPGTAPPYPAPNPHDQTPSPLQAALLTAPFTTTASSPASPPPPSALLMLARIIAQDLPLVLETVAPTPTRQPISLLTLALTPDDPLPWPPPPRTPLAQLAAQGRLLLAQVIDTPAPSGTPTAQSARTVHLWGMAPDSPEAAPVPLGPYRLTLPTALPAEARLLVVHTGSVSPADNNILSPIYSPTPTPATGQTLITGTPGPLVKAILTALLHLFPDAPPAQLDIAPLPETMIRTPGSDPLPAEALRLVLPAPLNGPPTPLWLWMPPPPAQTPPDLPDSDTPDAAAENDGHRFCIAIAFPALGLWRLDGALTTAFLRLTARTRTPPPVALQTALRQDFEQALSTSGLTGRLSFCQES